MEQEQLFYDDFESALRQAVHLLGGCQAVGAALWPAKTLKAADSWLSDCLNPGRPAKLGIDEVVEVLRMARAEGIHCAMHQLCSDAGYERPGIAAKKTKHQELAEQFEREASKSSARLQNIAAEMAAIDADKSRPPIREAAE